MAGEVEKLLKLLDERLAEHDEKRVEVQNKLKEACPEIKEDAGSLEEKMSGELTKKHEKYEEKILGLIEKFNKGKGDMDALMKRAEKELSKERIYEVKHSEKAKSFSESYKLKTSSTPLTKVRRVDDTTEDEASKIESIKNLLQEHLKKVDKSKGDALKRLDEICKERKNEADKMYDRINEELKELFEAEDARIQNVKAIIERIKSINSKEEKEELIRKAKLTLLRNQKYELVKEGDSLDKWDILAKKEPSLDSIDFEERKPTNFASSFTKNEELSISFKFFSDDEEEVLKEIGTSLEVEVEIREKGRRKGTPKTLKNDFVPWSDGPICFSGSFSTDRTYSLKMRVVHQEMSTQWSDETELTTPKFKECCIWKECPNDVKDNRKYSVSPKNPRTATKTYSGSSSCCVIGSTSLPLNKVTSWSIKILKSRYNDGGGIFIGVAPLDIDQNEDRISKKCGWYSGCYDSQLWSGPPHNSNYKKYGPRKGDGEYVHTGDSVGVIMDVTKGELSFVVNGENLGVAYEGIPLDKPLVPCVLLKYKDDSVELDLTEVKEALVDKSVPIPSKITTNCGNTWDSITLTWDAVKGASFYQIEVDGSKFWYVSTTNIFSKVGLLPDTEHKFRVRAVKGNYVSKWSGVVKRRTKKKSFETSAWKECPDDAVEKKKYFIDEMNPRVALNVNNDWCTIIGNTDLPNNKVTSWSVRILNSENNNGGGIYIGVILSDIGQNMHKFNYITDDGWYFYCYDSTLRSGPPHNYNYPGKEYGPRKKAGEYVHNGDSVGVVMDTSKGELSFIVDGVNHGVAYKGIPLDKPLVPCVLLFHKGDSVELVI